MISSNTATQQAQQKSQISDEERINWLRLIRTSRIGNRGFADLVKLCGSASNAVERLPELAKKPVTLFRKEKAEAELEAIARYGAQLLIQHDEAYPNILKQIDDAPPVLTVKGDVSLLQRDMVAMVGARNASINGCRFARKLATELGKAGHVVISGLARGIDTAAHEGSVAYGTVAVIAGGINHIYPKENGALYDRIAEEGLVIAELAFDSVPRAEHFPQRNRIIAGLSKATIVVEAAIRSGSLITARLANEQGREVFAVPGSPMDPRCAGPNKLIQDGAQLVQSAQDVLEVLENPRQITLAMQESPFEYTPEPLDEQTVAEGREALLAQLGATPTPIDVLAETLNIPMSQLLTLLLELELSDKLARHPGNRVSLLYSPSP